MPRKRKARRKPTYKSLVKKFGVMKAARLWWKRGRKNPGRRRKNWLPRGGRVRSQVRKIQRATKLIRRKRRLKRMRFFKEATHYGKAWKAGYRGRVPGEVSRAWKVSQRKRKNPGKYSRHPLIRQMVGNLYVGAPDSEVEKLIRSRIKKSTPERTLKAMVRGAIDAHRENQKQYKWVMGGHNYGRRRKNPGQAKITLGSAKETLRNLNMVITKRDGEYRVNFKSGGENTAYYTNDLHDAVGTAKAMRGGSLGGKTSSNPGRGEYQTRFIKQDQLGELINLYHLAKVPLSGRSSSKYDRMLWASREFSKLHPEVSSMAAYKDLDSQLVGHNPLWKDHRSGRFWSEKSRWKAHGRRELERQKGGWANNPFYLTDKTGNVISEKAFKTSQEAHDYLERWGAGIAPSVIPNIRYSPHSFLKKGDYIQKRRNPWDVFPPNSSERWGRYDTYQEADREAHRMMDATIHPWAVITNTKPPYEVRYTYSTRRARTGPSGYVGSY